MHVNCVEITCYWFNDIIRACDWRIFLGQNIHPNFYQMRQNSIVSFFSIIIVKLLNIISDNINVLKVSDIKVTFSKLPIFSSPNHKVRDKNFHIKNKNLKLAVFNLNSNQSQLET